MVHNVLIAVHAVAGVVSFAAGAVSLRLTARTSRPWRAYMASLTIMVVAVGFAVAADWSEFDAVARWVFAALLGLGAYMIWRAGHAGVLSRRRKPGWRPAYIDDVGFTLIALFEGFVIVAAIDLDAPGWLVTVVAGLGLLVGIQTKNRVKARLTRTPEQAGRP